MPWDIRQDWPHLSGHFAYLEGKPMRILWMSNSPLAGTGYGVQTAEVVPRLQAAGHEVAIANNWGQAVAVTKMGDTTIFPSIGDQALNDCISAYAQLWRADWTISLYDVWTMRRSEWPQNVASWVPVDHQPVPPEVANWCRQVTPIAMSRFGQRMLREQGIESSYIPHSVNTEVFRPTDRAERKSLGIPADAFVVMIAAANKGVNPARKAWGEMFDALGVFMSRHPNVWIYLHTNLNVTPPAGVDLSLLIRQTGIDSERVRWVDPLRFVMNQVSQSELAGLYSMSDVLLASSMGEGFGIPVIEAQACGLPVIVSDFSAQPELCESGWLVGGQPWRDPFQHFAAFFTPYVGSILKNLEAAYEAKGDQSIRERAISFAAEYETGLVFDRYWQPFLAELEATPAPLPRAERRRRAKAKGKAA